MLLEIQRYVRGLLTAGLVLAGYAAVAADDDFAPPGKAEREAVAALIER